MRDEYLKLQIKAHNDCVFFLMNVSHNILFMTVIPDSESVHKQQ